MQPVLSQILQLETSLKQVFADKTLGDIPSQVELTTTQYVNRNINIGIKNVFYAFIITTVIAFIEIR